MARKSRSGDVGIGSIGLAAVGSVAISTAWYTAWGDRLGRLHPAYAGDTRPPAWVPPVELARSATVATGVAVLARRAQVAGRGEALALGAGLWTAFPLVLLSGSVCTRRCRGSSPPSTPGTRCSSCWPSRRSSREAGGPDRRPTP